MSEALSLSLTHGSRTGILGTPLYLAPEQERPGAPVDGRTDLYAFGKLLYHMLTGEAPRTVRPVERARPGLADGWSEVVFRLTETDPDRRYQSAEACAEAIRALHAPPPAALAAPGVAPRAASAASPHTPNARGVPGLPSSPAGHAASSLGAWLARGDRLAVSLAVIGALVAVGGAWWGTRDAWIGTLVGAVGVAFGALLGILRRATPGLGIRGALRVSVPLLAAMLVVIGAEPHVVLEHAGRLWVGLGLFLGSVAALDSFFSGFPAAAAFPSRVPAVLRTLLGVGGAVAALFFTDLLPDAFWIWSGLWLLVELAVGPRLFSNPLRWILAILLPLWVLGVFFWFSALLDSQRVSSTPRVLQGPLRPQAAVAPSPAPPAPPRAHPEPRSPERPTEGGF